MNTLAIGINSLTTLSTLSSLSLKKTISDTDMNTFTESNDEVIARLKFIGHIQRDDKIDVKNVNIQPNTFMTRILRTLSFSEDRKKTLKFIRNILQRTFEIIELNLSKEQLDICKSIIGDLIRARQGITNMKATYEDDIKFCCDMDVLIESVNNKIIKLKEEFPALFEPERDDKKLEKREDKKEEKKKN